MALTPLDGTDATLDVLIAFSGTVGSSIRCAMTSVEYNSTRQYQSAETMCSSGWADELPGRRQDFITVGKLTTKGSVISDASVLMGATNAAAITFLAGTGCTKTGAFWISDDRMAAAAGIVAMPGSMVFRSKGPVATAWVTS